jgi:MoxR-like ATPase
MASASLTTRERLTKIIDEMNLTHKERGDIITGMWTAAVAQQHFLLIGPGGTGKSMVVRDLAARIKGATYFEKALDETSTPDEVLGPPDIKTMVEQGKTRRVTTGMLPEATHAFIDEFFNANGPTLHSTMPLLNERIHHNNGQPTPIPLRSGFMGTNKLNADVDMAALWDRVHHRHPVKYVSDREHLQALVTEAVLRRAGQENEFTTVTLEEMDAAHQESLQIPVPDATYAVFLDLVEALRREGVEVSTRRIVEGMVGVLATAWLNGHTDGVKVGDLGVLQNMFWTLQDQISTVRSVVLDATNPGEKKALELLEDLDALKGDYTKATGLDEVKRNAAAIDIFKKVDRTLSAAVPLLDQAQAVGAGTQRINDCIDACDALKARIGLECFGLTEEQIKTMKTR